MTVSLPDDVVLEILLRLKDVPPALFRCAMACKHWRGLVGDLSFLRRCWPENTFVGFIPRERLDEKGTKELVPVPGSALGRGLRALSSFVPALPAGAVPIVSRHGLLLVRLDSDPADVVQFAVCNLHVGTCHVLPPLSSRCIFNYDIEINCYVVLSAADCLSGHHDDDKLLPPPPSPSRSHSSSFFKVVIIGYNTHDLAYQLHTLSSHETSWSVRTDCFERTALDCPAVGIFSDHVVVSRGTAHWVFGNWLDECFYVVNLNTQTEDISTTKLPSDPSSVSSARAGYQQCLVLADGEPPSLLRMKKTQKRQLCLLGEKCGTLLISDSHERVYTADLETGMMERVVDWPLGRRIELGEVVLLEIDWAVVFVSRLATRYN
jgi:hypothetical protein